MLKTLCKSILKEYNFEKNDYNIVKIIRKSIISMY